MSDKNELQNILLGKSKVSHGTLIQTIISHLEESKRTSAMAETEEHWGYSKK